MNKNTLYFYEQENGVFEINRYYEKLHNIKAKALFEKLLLVEMTTLKGRIDAVKKIFSYSYNIPIFINAEMVFFKVFSDCKIWVNGPNVESVGNKEGKAIIIFNSGVVIPTDKNYRTIKRAMHRVNSLISYKNGLY